ncbi:MAG: enoyl-CoA hydratase/isomerase family protein [Chloroflexi bacterium]|nr:enoyl-CoA hydratase/isomerase family protein [Chloroflexota bacterium]
MMVQATPPLTLELKAGSAVLTLDRPPLNILDIATLRAMEQFLHELGADASVRVLILQAAGKYFSAGVDVAEHTPERVGEMIPLFHRVCLALMDFPVPTLAAIHGHALGGGCELALCCDISVLAGEARLGQPEVQLAALAPIAAALLPRLIGSHAAAELLLTGQPIDAERALQLRMVNAVVPAQSVHAWAHEKAAELAKLSRAALTLNKRALRLGAAGGLANLQDLEQLYLNDLMQTHDAREGLSAFMEKRTPEWKHE